jgi:ketosteroid isomerase-like protein
MRSTVNDHRYRPRTLFSSRNKRSRSAADQARTIDDACRGICHLADVPSRLGCDDPCMTQLTNPAKHNHPNFVRAQAAFDAGRKGDYGPTFEMLAEEVIMENGPGAGPWHIARGKEDMALMLLEFSAALGNTFHQDGRCVYADDRMIINLIHETGRAPSGDEFDNLAVYVGHIRADGQIDRVWTVDLDTEHCEEFWRRNQGNPSKVFG